MIDEVYAALTDSLWLDIHIGIGYCVGGIGYIPESYQSAQIALYYKFLSPDKKHHQYCGHGESKKFFSFFERKLGS